MEELSLRPDRIHDDVHAEIIELVGTPRAPSVLLPRHVVAINVCLFWCFVLCSAVTVSEQHEPSSFTQAENTIIVVAALNADALWGSLMCVSLLPQRCHPACIHPLHVSEHRTSIRGRSQHWHTVIGAMGDAIRRTLLCWQALVIFFIFFYTVPSSRHCCLVSAAEHTAGVASPWCDRPLHEGEKKPVPPNQSNHGVGKRSWLHRSTAANCSWCLIIYEISPFTQIKKNPSHLLQGVH